ncbi:MAG: sigma-54 dependent transcriptional regulator [Rikenellaceae bacterium]
MDLLSVKQRFGIIGTDEAMARALDVAMRVASTDLSVLITGESGVGKEFFPQVIHINSPRKHNNYIAVNCGAIPEGTIDSELFGHEKGAFTGANDTRKGYFEVADGGTIFLDEVAELPQTTQVRLLRVLQTGEFIRVGSSKTQKTNVRVVAATNGDLRKAIAEGKFREDLYYRLNTVPIVVPPLRDRKGDIFLLFKKFAVDIASTYRMPVISLDENARAMLENYSWPGNVRQLKNVAEQISAIEEQRNITPDILAKYLPAYGSESVVPMFSGSFSDSRGGDERDILYKILFDIKADVSEIKRMLRDMNMNGVVAQSDITPLINALPAAITPLLGSGEAEFAESAEVVEEKEEMTKERVQREAIIKALRKNNGRRKEAARELFMSERTLYRKIKELEINEY